MRKTKWLNLQGSVLAATTLAAVAAGARHVQRKYAGKKSSLFTFDKEYLTNYAFERFVLDNDKVTNFINSHLGQTENK